MSTVKLPPVLRASVGGAKEVEASGATVGEVLRSLAQQHPARTHDDPRLHPGAVHPAAAQNAS